MTRLTADSSTGERERLRVGGDEVALRVTSDATGGVLMAVDVRLPAGGGPPVLHRHAAEEVYRVDEGALAIYVEDDSGAVRRIDASAGPVVHIPGGRAHTVRNESEADAHAYVVFAPGSEMERFVRAAAASGVGGPPRMDDVLALAARHGMEMAGPVPTAR